MRRSLLLRLTLVAAATWLVIAAAAPPAIDAAAPQQPQPPAVSGYTLVDTWADVPWMLRAGHYGEATDISSAPDGTTYVLDGYHGAVHSLAPDGTPRDVFRLPTSTQGDGRWEATAIDVGFDGRPHVLSVRRWRRDVRARVTRLAPDGTVEDRFESFYGYDDLAVRRDGRIYLVISGRASRVEVPTVDVFDADGDYLESIRFPELDAPLRVDVAADDTIYVLQEITPPPSTRPPGPTPTPGPSYSDASSGAPVQADPIPGVVVISPEHAYVETVPFASALDVAVGPAGVFVAPYGAVVPLREIEPLTPYVDQPWTGRLRLDVPTDGRVQGALSHCAFEGVLSYADPSARPAVAELSGALDRPALEGPIHPLRVAADDDAVLLQGRYRILGQRPNTYYDSYPVEPQSVQRWSLDGTLTGQLGLCSLREERASWTHDVAADGADVYHVDSSCVTRRADPHFATWTQCPALPDGRPHLVAVAADDGRVAVLDGGPSAVHVLDSDGGLVAQWPIDDAGPTTAPADLALDGDRLYLADRARARVLRYTLDGRRLGAWRLHDAPVGIDVGPAGDVYVLGANGWGLRYQPDGTLVAAWQTPQSRARAVDLAVLADGRVLVPFVEVDPLDDVLADLEAAGVWVFAPTDAPAAERPTPPDGCRAVPDKTAAPARLPLGAAVEVRLAVDGRCPGRPEPLQLAIVFDTSRSMNWGYALNEARYLTLELLRALDPTRHEVALVTFADQPALEVPLTRDLVSVGQAVTALRGAGDTQLAGALDVARLELTGPARDPDAGQMVLLVTDANPKDESAAALDALGAAGVDLAALIVERGQAASGAFVGLLDRSGGRMLRDPTPEEVAAFGAGLARRSAEPGLFEQVAIVDELPANMRYVPGSAAPAAAHDPAARTLTWQLGPVTAAAGVRLRYDVVPQAVGTWPTNVRATADYRDARRQDGRLVFPVPEVTVLDPSTTTAYLPFAVRSHCVRRTQPVDVALVLDTSSSMAEPAAGGGTKLEAAVAAAHVFLDQLRLPTDRAAVVSFSAKAEIEAALTGERSALEAALGRLSSRPGTRIDRGLVAARALLASGGRTTAQPVVVLLTDGRQSPEGDVGPPAAALRADGVLVYAIGLGADVDRARLVEISGDPARTFVSPTEVELAAIYRAVAARLACEVR